MSRQAIIPDRFIPYFCNRKNCGCPIPSAERERRTHPFLCSSPEGPHETFVSPKPVAIHILFVRLEGGRLGVAMGRRGLEHEVAYDQWALPGGYTEAETGAEAAIGEFWEEFRVDVSDVPVEHVSECFDPDTYCLIHFYAGLWPDAEPPQLQTTEEMLEARIFEISDLPPDMAFPYQAQIIREAARRF